LLLLWGQGPGLEKRLSKTPFAVCLRFLLATRLRMRPSLSFPPPAHGRAASVWLLVTILHAHHPEYARVLAYCDMHNPHLRLMLPRAVIKISELITPRSRADCSVGQQPTPDPSFEPRPTIPAHDPGTSRCSGRSGPSDS